MLTTTQARKRILAAFAAMATAFTLSAAPAHADNEPAQAAPAATGYDRCQDGYFCIFEHADGQGRYAAFKAGTDNLGDPKVFKGYLNDKASSVWNRDLKFNYGIGWRPWCLYEHKDRGGVKWRVGPRGGAGSKGNLGAANDRATTVRPAHYIKPPGRPYGYYTC